MTNDPDDLRRVLANLDLAIDYAGAEAPVELRLARADLMARRRSPAR